MREEGSRKGGGEGRKDTWIPTPHANWPSFTSHMPSGAKLTHPSWYCFHFSYFDLLIPYPFHLPFPSYYYLPFSFLSPSFPPSIFLFSVPFPWFAYPPEVFKFPFGTRLPPQLKTYRFGIGQSRKRGVFDEIWRKRDHFSAFFAQPPKFAHAINRRSFWL